MRLINLRLAEGGFQDRLLYKLAQILSVRLLATLPSADQ